MIQINDDKSYLLIRESGEQVRGELDDELFLSIQKFISSIKTEEDLKQEFIDEKLSEMTDEEVVANHVLVKDWKPRVGYVLDELVKYEGVVYRLIKGITADTNIHTPDVVPSEYEDLTKKLPQEDGSLPVWKQPLGGHDAYKIGDKVQHKDKEWECVQGNTEGLNTWEPGVYGWKEIL